MKRRSGAAGRSPPREAAPATSGRQGRSAARQPAERRLARQAERRYLAALLRSRRAVARILGCVADLAERDDACARALAERPEALEALARCVEGVPWASPRRRVHTRPGAGPGAPYAAVPASRRRRTR